MTVRATDILKAIQKLNPAEKHRLREYLIDALTASSSTGTVLQENLSVKTRVAIIVLIASRSILFGLVNIQLLLMVKKLKNNVIAVKRVKRHLLTLQIPLCIEHVVLTNG